MPEEGIRLEPLLSTLARVLANDGLARELAVLTYAKPSLEHWGEDWGVDVYRLHLCIPYTLYAQIVAERESCAENILVRIPPLILAVTNEDIRGVMITPQLIEDDKWREKALTWLTGQRVSNQGRVRSDNVAPRTADGLLFRSEPEIHLYKALKSMGVSFAPLPVFVHGGQQYRRIEPDFVILKDGIVLVVEVDGDTYHKETPSEAHNRTTMLAHEGAFIERVNAEECDTADKAEKCARKLLEIISKLKNAR